MAQTRDAQGMIQVEQQAMRKEAPRDKVAEEALDKMRAGRRMLESAKALLAEPEYQVVRAGFEESAAPPERRVLELIRRLNALDQCLARRCILRTQSASGAVAAATSACVCAGKAASRKRPLRDVGDPQRRVRPSPEQERWLRAVAKHDVRAFEDGLESGDANAAGADRNGMTALMLAAKHGHADLVGRLLARGVPVDAADALVGRTALLWAAHCGHKDICRAILEAGADINAVAKDGTTALVAAARNGDEATAQILLAKRPDLELSDSTGRTALLCAASRGCTSVAVLLAQRCANLEHVDREGCSALLLAARAGRFETVLALGEVGCDPSARSHAGLCLLHFAARSGHTTVLKALFSSFTLGARARDLLDARCSGGRTPLMMAAAAGRTASACALVREGALADARTDEGLNALQLARQEGFEETAQEILRAVHDRRKSSPAVDAQQPTNSS